jgi:hypothetical protein
MNTYLEVFSLQHALVLAIAVDFKNIICISRASIIRFPDEFFVRIPGSHGGGRL